MKCDKTIVERKIVMTNQIETELSSCINSHKPVIILMGDGTWSKKLRNRVKKVCGDIPFKLVNEKHSTERGRERYFVENPPKGLWKLIPVTMQVPKEPIDDYAAVIMAEDYIDKQDTFD